MNSKTRLFFYSAMVSVSMLATFACGDDGESPDDGTGGSGASDAGDGGASPVTTGGKGGTTGGSKSGGDAGSGGEPDEPGTGGAAPTGGNDSTGGRATGGKAGGGDAGSGQSTGGRMTTDGGAAGSGGAPADECDEGFYGPTCQPCDCETGNCNDGMEGDGACICPPGTTGADCDRCAFGFQDKDENGTCELACANNTCNGHGTCNDSTGEVQCTCAAAYTGARCTECAAGYQDNDENGSCLRECDEDTCNEHGECSDATGTIVCSCEGGYTGTFCDNCAMGEQDNDDDGTCSPACDEDSCGENGDCDDDDGSLACDCYEGYDGAACDECAEGFQDNDDNDSCEPACGDNSCPENADCDDGDGSLGCTCQEGYDGEDCDQCAEGFQDNDDNDSCEPACAEDTCAEHADCDDDDGSLECTCQEGYEGEDCDQCADGYEDDGNGVCEPLVDDPCVEAEFEGPPVGIPDDDEAGGAPVELVIATDFPVGEVELTVSVTHGHTGDLAVSLENSEHFVIVHAGNGCGEANWSSVTFDDDAQDPVACEADVTSPPSYQPFEPLSTFNGDGSADTWTVIVYDALAGETGTVDYAKIRICPQEP
ncbi:MAG: hypothetical protein M3020_20880 [Myxococcota bacterium]|nr:hypothetical protein [Myxococcota bacterium]